MLSGSDDKKAKGLNSQSPPAVDQSDKTPNKFVQFWRRVYRPLGFHKGYNFPLCWLPFSWKFRQILTASGFIFGGALFGFTLAKLSYLNIGGNASSSFANSASPGEWFWYRNGIYRIGITIHLATILPAGLLMPWQFLPVIRHKVLMLHRINGYAIVILVIISNIGAVMIVRRAFGGTLATQAGVGVLAIMSTVSIALAYYNIKRLQIEQHRAWMLRAMFYLATIVTLRLIMIIAALIISQSSNYYTTMECGSVRTIYNAEPQKIQSLYPQCTQPGSANDTLVIVQATFGNGQPEQIGASLRMNFGMALWMALLLHAVGVEIYLGLTPRETNRLRQVSYERQMERGMKHPGSAGLTSDRFGDADPWKPLKEVELAGPGVPRDHEKDGTR
ncbi:MAG: hypothetical protein Q9228_002018 [Teloschistes exilis]